MAVLDSTQFSQLVQEVQEALLASSQGVGEVEVVNSLDNIVSLPALRLIGQTETVVEAPLTLLSLPAVEAAVAARNAAEDATIAAVNASSAADVANSSQANLESIKEQVVKDGSNAAANGDKAFAGAVNAENATLYALQIASYLQTKLEQAQVVVLSGRAMQDVIDTLDSQVMDNITVCVETREEAYATILQLRELQKQIAQAIADACSALGYMLSSTAEARQATMAAIREIERIRELSERTERVIIESVIQTGEARLVALRLEELEDDLLFSKSASDTATRLANEQADRAKFAADEAIGATQNALEATSESLLETGNAKQAALDALAAKAEADISAELARDKAANADDSSEKALLAKSEADIAATRALDAEQRAIEAAKTAENIVVGIRPNWEETDKTNSNYISNKPEMRTLGSVPMEDTLTYINRDGNEVSYKIGDDVRVENAESEQGYTFFRLYDITSDGKAVWAEGGGGGGDLREKVRISLSSNQTQPDASLIGASVIVTDVTLDKVVMNTTWNGQEILAKVTALSDYTVQVGDVAGYATPQPQQFTSSIQGDRSVQMIYNSCLLTVRLDSNQESKEDIASAQATVSYSDVEQTLRSEESVKVPYGEMCTVVASSIEHYKTPDTVSFMAENPNKDVLMVYNSCALTVTIEGIDEDVPGITVSYGSVTRTVASGATLNVPYGELVTVSCPDVDGYGTPEEVSFTPSTASYSVTMTYIASALVVTIDSNQSDKTDLSALKATVTFGESSIQVNSGQMISIPVNTEITVSFPALTGYKVPDDIVFTNAGGLVEKTGTYLTELVTVTLSSDNAVSVTGQVVSINGTEYTYQGVPVSAKIPFDTQYTVSVNAKDQYITPQPQIVTASQAQRSISMVYVYNPIKYSYVTLNQTFTDSATMLSGDINGDAVQLIKQNTHRVLAKKTADGEVTYCRLKDDDGAKYHDGTNAVLNGNEGDVFTKPPQFFWKVTSESTDIFKIGLAYGGNPGEGWHEWDGNILIGTYEAYNSSSKLYSRSGVTPTANVSQANFKAYARNRGTGYRIVDWEMHCVMAMLYYCQYGHMNCQLKIGAGTSSYPKVTGGTNALGMTDTVAGGNGDSGSINFFGLENWWGDLYEWVDNVVFNNGVATITNPDGSTRTVQGYNITGYYPKKMVIGECFDLIGKESGGSDTTGYCDYYYLSTTATSRVVRRSNNGSYTHGGVSSALANDDSSNTYSSIGSRLAFRGVCVEAESVEAFKALPVM